MASAFGNAGTNKPVPVLVYFADKGNSGKGGLQAALLARRAQLSARALKRRAKIGRAELSFEDLPVSSDYVSQIEATGARLRQRLNWFNAASFEMTRAQVQTAAGLGFVRRIELLAGSRKMPEPSVPVMSESVSAKSSSKDHLLDYGPSHMQLHLMNADVCHDSGYSGAGVLVAMFDNGFRKNHQAFDSIMTAGRLVDEWDFCSNTDTVDWASHGTGTWSEAGGYVPGQLIGPAYQSLWAVYHTESNDFEQNVEEDYWAAALQRADSIGADIVSSSLGYRYFDAGQHSYPYSELDGNTAICSQAARHAAALGIVVCTAMGNDGYSGIGSLLAPADADSILSVGNVDSTGLINPGSSLGPAYDGRPKPEVCAQGTNVCWASWTGVNNYSHYATGTSCATPLVAGVCALVLEAHPSWTPMQVREALMMTASRHDDPDNTTYGRGIVDAWAAIRYDGSGVHDHGTASPAEPGLQLTCRPNPIRSTARLCFLLSRAGAAAMSVYDITGRLVRALPVKHLPAGKNEFVWDGRDGSGARACAGVYLFRLCAMGRESVIKALLMR